MVQQIQQVLSVQKGLVVLTIQQGQVVQVNPCLLGYLQDHLGLMVLAGQEARVSQPDQLAQMHRQSQEALEDLEIQFLPEIPVGLVVQLVQCLQLRQEVLSVPGTRLVREDHLDLAIR